MRLLEAVRAYVAELEEEAAKASRPPAMLPGGLLPVPVMRYKAIHQMVPKHDARGDARQLVIEKLSSKHFNPADAQTIAAAFVDYYAEVLHTNYVPYQDGVYEMMDGAAGFCKRVNDLIGIYVRKMAAGEIPVPVVPAGWDSWTSCAHAERNARSHQEDRHIAAHDLTLWKEASPEPLGDGGDVGPPALFCVFDGHGGPEVSHYAAGHIASTFIEAGYRADEPTIRRTFELMDARSSVRCEREAYRGGSTAVVVAIDKKKIACGWCGDSGILMMRSAMVERITTNHSPKDPVEHKRVIDAGGMIMTVAGEMRVNGIINVTRSLGDVNGRPMIIALPDTAVVDRGPGDYCLILTSDGVSEELKDHDFYALIKSFCENNPVEEWERLPAHLCEMARTYGSQDNLTCLFVFLRPPAQLWELFGPDPDSEEEEQQQDQDQEIGEGAL